MSGTFFTILLTVYTVFGLLFYELRWVVWIDEIFAFAIAGYACIGIWLQQIPKYKPLMIWLYVDAFYLVYSLLIHSNVEIAIFNDFVMQSKPYMMFFGLMCIKPKLNEIHWGIIHLISIFSILCILFIYFTTPDRGEECKQGELLSGAAFSIVALFIGALYYLSSGTDGFISRVTSFAIMCIGLLAPTAKYTGTLICAFIFLFFVSSPIKINLKSTIIFLITSVLVVFTVWSDIDFYFLQNTEDNARAVLYMCMPDILNDYIPFGSGFATFANAASATWYSPLYAKYGLDEIWGLMEEEADFASDAYYPTLAQFGYVGIILFIIFLIYIFRRINKSYKTYHDIKRYKVAFIIIISILIEMTTGSFSNERCIMQVMLLCLCLYKYNPTKTSISANAFGLKHLKIKYRNPQTKESTNNARIDN